MNPPTNPRGSLLLGLLRIAIPLLAVALYIWHISPSIARRLGNIPVGDTEQILLAHQNRSYRYQIYSGDQTVALGSFTQRLGWEDTFYNITTTLRLDQPEQIPGLAILKSSGLGGPLALDASIDLDDRKRLIALSAEGRLGDLSGKVDAHVAGNDVQGTYRLSGRGMRNFTLSNIDTSTQSGLSFALVLPPDLASGMGFSIQSLTIGMTAPYLFQDSLDYVVGESIAVNGPAGQQQCLMVTVSKQGKQLMELMVDQNGVIHRAQLSEFPLRADLEQILDAGGDQLWPPLDLIETNQP